MNRTDDISNLFSRFGATSDSYYEFESQSGQQNVSLEKGMEPPAQVPVAEAVVASVATIVAELPVAQAPVKMATFSLISPIAQPAAPTIALPPPKAEEPLMTSADVATPLRNLLAEVALARQLEAQALHDAALAKARPPKCKAHIVALVSAKGGVGKTTLGAGLASSLRLDGGKTVAIDLDPQNALHCHLGVESSATGMGSSTPPGLSWNDKLQQGFNGVQLLPYGVLSDEERCALERDIGQDRHWLAWQLERLALGENDVVILDTPTGGSRYLEQALDVADQVIVVTTADAASFIALDHMDRLLGAADTRRASSACSYVVNQFDASREFSQDMYEVFKRRLGGKLLCAIERDNTLGEALAYGRNPLATAEPSIGCQNMFLLCEQLKARFQNTRAAEISAR